VEIPLVMIKKIIFLLVALSFNSVYAQSSRCSTDEFLAAKFENNQEMKLKYEKTIHNIRAIANNKHAHKVLSDEEQDVLTIPVVFHVVYRSFIQNIPDERIHEQMDILNADYAGLNSDIGSVPDDFTEFVGSSRIRFELASVDPLGNSTTGINRYETDSTVFGLSDDGIKHSELGGADAWESDSYLNIWVGRIENGILGYATPPNSASSGEDGVVIGYKYVGLSSSSSYDLGRTATHEVGHYLGLTHIWGYGASCTSDDGISDTPTQLEAHYANPGHPSLSCGSADMFMNYMDYVEDVDMFFFTSEQMDNMEIALEQYREGLLVSGGLSIEEELTEQDFQVFPVPVNKGAEFFILVPESANIHRIELVDILGRVQLFNKVDQNSKELSVHVDGISTGVYLLKLSGENYSFNKRIVIR